jgi:hypothetical protein
MDVARTPLRERFQRKFAGIFAARGGCGEAGLSGGLPDVASFPDRMSGNSFWIVMNSPADQVHAKSARCPRCRSVFDCALHGQPFDCWCKAMPALPAARLEPGGRCLCPECLAAEIARGQAGPMAGGEAG